MATCASMDRDQFSWPLDGLDARSGSHLGANDLDWLRFRSNPSSSPARSSGRSMGHRNQADSNRDGIRTTLPPAADGEFDRGTMQGNTMSKRGGRGCRTYCSCSDTPSTLC
eukprot:208119-Amphidinium_carterae.4